MATAKTSKTAKPAAKTAAKPPRIDLHASVGNEADEEAASVKRAVSKPPAEGPNPRSNKVGSNGAEQVAGFKLASFDSAREAMELSAPDTSNLQDIGVASFGDAGGLLETVHGVDNRTQITSTNVYPWRATASLLITAADNSQWIGTGWFISARTLITAGHCVCIKGSGVPGRDGWVKRIVVMPGRNGNSLPYGSVTSTTFRSVTGWTSSGNAEYDYGAIILPTPLGNSTGWFGFGNYTDAELLASVGNIAGYPGDKPSGTMWYDARRIAAVSARKVHYDIDTAGGQSGAAVYRIVNGGRYAFAVHAYGGASTNSGTRINSAVYGNLLGWRA